MKNTLKVVLADDEALIRLDIREMLTEGGHEVAGEANNGEDAVAMTRALQPDLVIMDVKMPQMDGLTASKIITDEHLAPVLLLTAYSQQEIVSQAKSSGVLGYLVKPVRDAHLPGGRRFAHRQRRLARSHDESEHLHLRRVPRRRREQRRQARGRPAHDHSGQALDVRLPG